MPDTTEKRTFIELGNMATFSNELKAKYAKKSAVNALANRVKALEDTGAEANVLEGIKVNDTLLSLTEKVAEILIAEGTTNGTIKVNSVDVAVHGLAALAFKAEVSLDDMAETLKAMVNRGKTAADTVDTLTGEGDGSISKMIDAAINDFATKVSDDNVVNSFKELIDWVAEHGSEAEELAGGIAENKTAITDLKNLVGTIPEDAAATTVVGYIAEAIAALSIGDYAKTSEVTAAINTALEGYYTSAQVDAKLEGYVKASDIQTATEAEIKALLADEDE